MQVAKCDSAAQVLFEFGLNGSLVVIGIEENCYGNHSQNDDAKYRYQYYAYFTHWNTPRMPLQPKSTGAFFKWSSLATQVLHASLAVDANANVNPFHIKAAF